MVQRDCSTAHQRHGGNGRKTAVVIEVEVDFCSFGLAAYRGSRRHGDRSAAGAERLKLSSTVSRGSEVHEDRQDVGVYSGVTATPTLGTLDIGEIEAGRYQIQNQDQFRFDRYSSA